MKNVKFLVRVMVLVSNSVSNSFTFSKVVGKCTFKHCLINRYFLANLSAKLHVTPKQGTF